MSVGVEAASATEAAAAAETAVAKAGDDGGSGGEEDEEPPPNLPPGRVLVLAHAHTDHVLVRLKAQTEANTPSFIAGERLKTYELRRL